MKLLKNITGTEKNLLDLAGTEKNLFWDRFIHPVRIYAFSNTSTFCHRIITSITINTVNAFARLAATFELLIQIC